MSAFNGSSIVSTLFDLAAVAVAYPLSVAGSAWLGGHVAAYVAVAIGVILAARFGLRARVGEVARELVLGRGVHRRGPAAGADGELEPAPARTAPERRGPVAGAASAGGAPAGLPLAPERALGLIRARVDEVAYVPGSPNVLSITKLVPRERGTAPGPGAASPAESWRQDDGEDTVLGLRGALDATTLPGLRPIFDALVAARRRSITLDLHELRAVDAAGAAAVSALHRRCKEQGGALLVSGLANQPLAVFRLLGLDARLARQ